MRLINAKDIGGLDENYQYFTYNGLDSAVTRELHDILYPQTWDLYEFEKKLMGPCLAMMRRGFKIDLVQREYLAIEYKNKIESILARIKSTVGNLTSNEDFNPNSYKQMQQLLYEDLMYPEQFAYKKGERVVTTDRDALERLYKLYSRCRPLIALLLTLRDAEKIYSVLTKGLDDGRWTFSINIGGTETGRFSSSKSPVGLGSNIQNLTNKMRVLFIPDEGYTLVSVDLKCAESKGVAYLALDENYIAACNSEDVHTMVAKDVWPDKVQDRESADAHYYRDYSYRDMSKRGQHGSNYYGTPYTMARHLKVPQVVMEDFQTKYFNKFPDIREGHRSTAIELQKTGQLTTPLGRRRQFWGRLRDDTTLREAIAYVPQSLIADITNMGLYKVWHYLEPKGLQVLAQCHDSVVAQIPTNKVAELLPLMVQYMTATVEVNGLEMTIECDAEVGNNWGKFNANPERGPLNLEGLKKWKG